MKCSSGCKYFKMTGVYGSGYPTITSSGTTGTCRKYNISTNTDKDCFDTLPYNKK